jgi:hypothetical protein
MRIVRYEWVKNAENTEGVKNQHKIVKKSNFARTFDPFLENILRNTIKKVL